MSSEPASVDNGEPAPGRLPDWITIGAMKAATSSLHRYLAEHPQISTSEPKELDFFVEKKYNELGIDWYRQQFTDPPNALSAGESSVNYTKVHEFPGVPERMHRHLPDVKLIYILRDPIKRAESQWIHSVGAGEWRGDFDSSVADPQTSLPIQGSCYWKQLQEFLKFYDPSQIKIMSYEQLSAEPHAAVREVLEYIGLDSDWTHPLIGKKIHDSKKKMRPNALGMLFWEDRVRRRRIRKYLPYLTCSPIKKPEWNPELRARAEEVLRPEVEQIREFTGMDFPEWSL